MRRIHTTIAPTTTRYDGDYTMPMLVHRPGTWRLLTAKEIGSVSDAALGPVKSTERFSTEFTLAFVICPEVPVGPEDALFNGIERRTTLSGLQKHWPSHTSTFNLEVNSNNYNQTYRAIWENAEMQHMNVQ
jgi:hypothetical protein